MAIADYGWQRREVAARLRGMDSETETEADAAAAALEHDIDLLGAEAMTAGKRLAKKLGPPLAGFLVLLLVAWLLSRRWSKRHGNSTS